MMGKGNAPLDLIGSGAGRSKGKAPASNLGPIHARESSNRLTPQVGEVAGGFMADA
jgi:hypothetical protein